MMLQVRKESGENVAHYIDQRETKARRVSRWNGRTKEAITDRNRSESSGGGGEGEGGGEEGRINEGDKWIWGSCGGVAGLQMQAATRLHAHPSKDLKRIQLVAGGSSSRTRMEGIVRRKTRAQDSHACPRLYCPSAKLAPFLTSFVIGRRDV